MLQEHFQPLDNKNQKLFTGTGSFFMVAVGGLVIGLLFAVFVALLTK